MEVYYYRCPRCGFVHQVPAYWMSYAPEEEHEQMHFSPDSGDICPNSTLAYSGAGDEG